MMKKSITAILIALIICCLFLTSCQTKTEPAKDYVTLGFAFRNETGKTIESLYLYDMGSNNQYNDLIPGFNVPDGKWANESSTPMGFLIRPAAEFYEIRVRFEDGSELLYPALELLNANFDGFIPNEICLRIPAESSLVRYNEDEAVLNGIDEALFSKVPIDGFFPPK